jgi:hypothetical protein
MIPVDCNNYIFEDMVSAIDSYIEYTNLHFNKSIKNIFQKDSNGIPIIHFRDIDKIRESKSNIIIIDLITEGFNKFNFFNDYPNDKKYIFFSNGSWDQQKFPLDINYEILQWNYFIYDAVKRCTSSNLVDFFQDQQYVFSNSKEFEFSALIGHSRPWRETLTTRILENITFKNYILNYNGNELNCPSRHLDINYNFSNYDSYRTLSQYYTISSSIPIELYNKSKILLVVETTMNDHNEFHLTEKTLKALLTGIPFIVAGSYKFLENLKSLGFLTYSELWSEEYDNISSTDDRIDKVINTLTDISKMLWNQTTLDKCQQIAYHNKQLLLNVNSIMKRQIISILEQFKNYEI